MKGKLAAQYTFKKLKHLVLKSDVNNIRAMIDQYFSKIYLQEYKI